MIDDLFIREVKLNNNKFVNDESYVFHLPIIRAFPDVDIFVFNDNKIRLTPYEETEHYVFTKEFLNNRHVFLKHLLD